MLSCCPTHNSSGSGSSSSSSNSSNSNISSKNNSNSNRLLYVGLFKPIAAFFKPSACFLLNDLGRRIPHNSGEIRDELSIPTYFDVGVALW